MQIKYFYSIIAIILLVGSAKAATTIDKFEYADDTTAQTVWIGAGSVDAISTMTSDTTPSGIASADSTYGTGFEAYRAMDDSLSGNTWSATFTSYPHWLQYQFATSKIVTKYSVTCHASNSIWSPTSWKLQSSNNGSDWTDLDTQNVTWGTAGETKIFNLSNPSSNLYYRLYCIAGGSGSQIQEWELIINGIAIYSESTIIHESSYSMQVVASGVTSLDSTITRTLFPTINLTDQTSIKMWVYASRAGSNFKIGFHDTGGTTTESSIPVNSANTWEEKIINTSAVSNLNKDAIDSIILTITNADSSNTIYLDFLMGYSNGEIIDSKYVYYTQTQSDGTNGTLKASTISNAKGSGSNLSASILKTGETVDDVTGIYTGSCTSGSGANIRGGFQ